MSKLAELGINVDERTARRWKNKLVNDMGRKINDGRPPEKVKLFQKLINAYDIKNVKDLQESLKDLLGGTIQSMLEQEIQVSCVFSV